MTTQDPNYTAFSLDQKGGAQAISSLEGIFSAHADQNVLVWLKCYKSDQTQQLLTNLGTIPKGIIEMLCADETRPRTLTINDTFIGIFRTVSAEMENLDAGVVTSIRIFVNKNLIVTIQESPLFAMNQMDVNFQANIGPKTAAECLVFLLGGIGERIAEVITAWDAILDQLESATSAQIFSTQNKLTQVRKRLIALRRYMIPQREAINSIEVENLTWFDEESQGRLSEEAESMVRLVEDLEAEKERAELVQEAVSSQSQQATNTRTYYLSIIASIFLPISFATGLLGSNLAGIPFATKPWSFPAFCLLLLLIALGIALFLRYRKWY